MLSSITCHPKFCVEPVPTSGWERSEVFDVGLLKAYIKHAGLHTDNGEKEKLEGCCLQMIFSGSVSLVNSYIKMLVYSYCQMFLLGLP